MIILFRKYFLILSLIVTINVTAQNQDSLKSYRLEEVTIKGILELEPESFITIDSSYTQKSDAQTLLDIGNYIPSIKVQTNSRGESLFFFRGAGERQLILFFDGIPLNIPWDNRIDLSLVPSSSIGEIIVLKGVSPAIFGPNAISGVINISSKKVDRDKGGISLQLGDNNRKSLTASWQNVHNDLSYFISASYKKADGYDLPASFDNPSNPQQIRLNSYVEAKNVFGKMNYIFSDSYQSGFLISFIDSKKGVPPEIGVENPRYWKYPVWQNLIIATNGNIKINQAQETLYYAFSYTKFKLQIDQFLDPSFLTIDDIEKNYDNILRGRVLYTNILNSASLIKVTLSGQFSNHNEEFLTSGFTSQTYSENIISTGAEYEYVQDKYILSLGGGFDWISTPQTGDKEPKEGNSDYSINAAFVYKIMNDFSVRFNIGRKTRFPSLRETFSGALGRFIPNPNLKAEIALSGEISFNYRNPSYSGDVSFFLSYLSDGIVRTSLPENKFQRINKDQVRNYGIELAGTFKPNDNIRVNFDFTYLNSFAKNINGNYSDTLEYKPKYISSVSIDYWTSNGFNLRAELDYLGKEFGLKEGSVGFQKIADYLLINLRAAYSFNFENDYDFEFYLRANNIFDRLYYTQFGLPEAGRQFLIGLNLIF